jgi:hypothetical protein
MKGKFQAPSTKIQTKLKKQKSNSKQIPKLKFKITTL